MSAPHPLQTPSYRFRTGVDLPALQASTATRAALVSHVRLTVAVAVACLALSFASVAWLPHPDVVTPRHLEGKP